MTTVTIVGNLTGDPELRFTSGGVPVAGFTIAHTPRVYDKTAGEYRDGETLFMRCSLWRDAAENATESLHRGTRVIATGKLKSRTFDQNGVQRTVIEMDVDEIGPSLRYATAAVTKSSRGGGGFGGQGGQQPKPADDPWNAAVPAADDQPPF